MANVERRIFLGFELANFFWNFDDAAIDEREGRRKRSSESKFCCC